jgi:hypothetical protein
LLLTIHELFQAEFAIRPSAAGTAARRGVRQNAGCILWGMYIQSGCGTLLQASHSRPPAPGFEPAVLFNCRPADSGRLAGAAEGPITARNPAPVLQLHPKVTVCLEKTEYYRWVYEKKPDWQKV